MEAIRWSPSTRRRKRSSGEIWYDIMSRFLCETTLIESPGSPARIGPNLLVTDDPDLFRHMNAPRSLWTRGTWYDGMKMDPRQNNILSERDEKKHAEMRAKMIGGVC